MENYKNLSKVYQNNSLDSLTLNFPLCPKGSPMVPSSPVDSVTFKPLNKPRLVSFLNMLLQIT